MRVRCANCGMIYDINPTSMDFQGPLERFSQVTCPGCKSNAKDQISKEAWKTGDFYEKQR